jgi:lysine-N-methylase
MEVLIDLALATVVISHFARCRAAAEGRARVTPEDVREGISVAELRLLHHAVPSGEDGIMPRLRALLLASRDFRQVLASGRQGGPATE